MDKEAAEKIDALLRPIEFQNQYEIEMRFGDFTEKTSQAGYRYSNFNSSVSPKEFNNVLNYFQNNKEFYLVKDSVTLKTEKLNNVKLPDNPQNISVNIYNKNVQTRDGRGRNISIRESYIPGYDSLFYSTKDSIVKVDLENLYTRISKSVEKDVDSSVIDNEQIASKRDRKRWSFRTDSNTLFKKYQIDISKVESIYNNRLQISYEIETEIIDTVKDYKEIYSVIVFIAALRQQTDNPIPANTKKLVITNYNNLFKDTNTWDSYRRSNTLYNPVSKPKNIKIRDILNPESLSVTDKADGVRKLMYVEGSSSFLLYPTNYLDIMKFSKDVNPELNLTVLDGEYLETKKEYLVFDIIVLNGVDQRNKDFSKRLEILKDIKRYFPKNVYLKKFLTPPENFYIMTNKILDSIPDKDYGNDGLIFNDINDVYKQNARIFKWKPPDLLTIDFKMLSTNKKGVFKFGVKDDRKDSSTKGDIIDFLVDNKPVYFRNDNIKENIIIEFNYIKDWKPFRIRDDRDEPNNLSTVESIWEDITNPIYEKTIRGHDLIAMRKIHNIEKKNMLSECRSQRLLDIGSGKGGDILKWRDYKIDVYAVEPNDENIKELYSRLKSFGYSYSGKSDNKRVYILKGNNTINVMQGYGEDTDKIVKFSGDVDCIVIFNALTFFFKDKDIFDSLLSTIERSGAETFMGMVMDGERVDSMLKDRKSVKEYGWSIKKKYSSENIFGRKIKIDLEAATVTDQTEYLVDFDYFVSHLDKLGFELDSSSFLDFPDRLSPSQNMLSRLYRSFIFRKKVSQENLPDVPIIFSSVESSEDRSSENMITEAILSTDFEIKGVSGISERNIRKLKKYIIKRFGRRWDTKPYKKLRKRYGDFSNAESILQDESLWKELHLLHEVADILKITLEVESNGEILQYGDSGTVVDIKLQSFFR